MKQVKQEKERMMPETHQDTNWVNMKYQNPTTLYTESSLVTYYTQGCKSEL